MANTGDAQLFSNISTTTSDFKLLGGKYGVSAIAPWSPGNVTLQTLAADGGTWITAFAELTENGYSTADLPPGQYRFAVTTATAVYLAICRIPEN